MPARQSADTRRPFDLIATNVAVVTVADDQGVHGCTANMWAEALEPPLLLVTLRRSSATRSRIKDCEHFAVNLLADDQRSLATKFARAGDRFAGSSIAVARSTSRCSRARWPRSSVRSLVSEHPFGAMEIMVGHVHETDARPDAAPLLFFARRFFAGPERKVS
jgi:flavin reductase (DIM6/NTAB) family NADH-FMN oxidoreductase RutF